ncbi:MAG: hypothetical protein AB7L71_04230 [Vicinamibacterales bacterium]
MAAARLTRSDISRLFELLNEDLAARGVTGEVYVVGGAVMCLAFGARDVTQGVDALLEPSGLVREAAARVATASSVDPAWLNDAVKTFLSAKGQYDPYLELSHLKVFTAHPHYLLALKCVGLRLAEEFHDLDDLRYLLRHLDIKSAEEALAIVGRYVDLGRVPRKTHVLLDSLVEGGTPRVRDLIRRFATPKPRA